MRQRKMVTLCVVIALCTAVLVILMSAASIPLITHVLQQEIHKEVTLINGSTLYKSWSDPELALDLQIYIFDLQNDEEVINGEKPFVAQRGPFTYTEQKVKVNVTHHSNGTVSYRTHKSYMYAADKSAGSEDVLITTANIPLLTLLDFLELYNVAIPAILSNLFFYLVKSEGIFITRSVREVVWGYDDPILEFVQKLTPYLPAHLREKINITSTKIGILANKNNSLGSVYTIYTGEKDISKLGIIEKYRGKKTLDYWSSKEANMINGSDGSLFPPFVANSKTILQIYSNDICRSLNGQYQDKEYVRGKIPCLRYTISHDAFANASVNPSNAGFCTPPGNCLGTGVLNISVCTEVGGIAIPLIASLPHFFLADSRYQNAVNGIDPYQPGLDTHLDIEPLTGIVMQAAKRLQMNVYIHNSTLIRATRNLPTMVYPLLWINESGLIDKESATKLYSVLLTPLQIAFIIQVVLFAVGGFLLLSTTVVASLWLRSKHHTVTVQTDEQSDVLIDSTDE